MVGSSLLITPVLHEGKTAVTGYFPSEGGTTWRDWKSGEVSLIFIPTLMSGSLILLNRSLSQTAKDRQSSSLRWARSTSTFDRARSS